MLYFVQVITIVAMGLLHTNCDAATGVQVPEFSGVNYCDSNTSHSAQDMLKICKDAGSPIGNCAQCDVEFFNTDISRQSEYILLCRGGSYKSGVIGECLTKGGSWPYIADTKTGKNYCKLWKD